jgi:CBS domain-containing membrane protein
MNPSSKNFMQRWLPALTSVDRAERLRACVGALLGILLTSWLSAKLGGHQAASVWLIAPMGASAVLLFALPASPLAQPWAFVGGNLSAALIGIGCAKLFASPATAAATAIGLSIATMYGLRCLHPPGGAVAVLTALGGPEIEAAGFGFVLAPVALNTLLLLLLAIAYNNLTGRRYPHNQRNEIKHVHQTTDLPPTSRLGFTAGDLQAALKNYNQVLDVSVDDLDALFRQTEMQSFRRRFGNSTCADIMSKDILVVEFATELAQAWHLMLKHNIQALPVIDRKRRILGIVTRTDFLRHADLRDHAKLGTRLKDFLRRNDKSHSDRHEVVGQIMSAPVKTASASMPIVELVPIMSDKGVHQMPIVDAELRLVGMVTQTDLVAALYEISLSSLTETSA